MVEDVAGEHAAESQTEPQVQADGRAIKHLPEPDERFADGEFGLVDFAEVVCFDGHVLGIEREAEHVRRQFASTA